MTDKPGNEERYKALFANLIMMLASSSMQQMGKTVNPLTNKAEVDLETARMTIDMIAMLQSKTKGNCDDSEDKMLKDVLSTLQLNFVETTEQVKNTAKKGPEKTENKQDPQADGEKNTEKKDPKFHKSYDS